MCAVIAFSEEDLRLAEIAGRMGTKEVVGGNPQVHLGFLARKKKSSSQVWLSHVLWGDPEVLQFGRPDFQDTGTKTDLRTPYSGMVGCP